MASSGMKKDKGKGIVDEVDEPTGISCKAASVASSSSQAVAWASSSSGAVPPVARASSSSGAVAPVARAASSFRAVPLVGLGPYSPGGAPLVAWPSSSSGAVPLVAWASPSSDAVPPSSLPSKAASERIIPESRRFGSLRSILGQQTNDPKSSDHKLAVKSEAGPSTHAKRKKSEAGPSKKAKRKSPVRKQETQPKAEKPPRVPYYYKVTKYFHVRLLDYNPGISVTLIPLRRKYEITMPWRSWEKFVSIAIRVDAMAANYPMRRNLVML